MSKEKQIEEITKILGCRMDGCEGCTYSEGKYPECAIKYTADEIYNAGYRKASEVTREIFEEIEDVLNNIGYFDELDFEALKNKYTEDGE